MKVVPTGKKFEKRCPRDMVCLGNMCMDTLHKGDNNNNNNNNGGGGGGGSGDYDAVALIQLTRGG